MKTLKSESKYVRKSKERDEEIANFMKLQCNLCSEEFLTFVEVKRHYRNIHDIKGYFICCNRKFYKRILILDHIRKHLNPESFKCYECNKTYASEKSLKDHNRILHELRNNETFKCDQCPKIYSGKYFLNRHMQTHRALEERCDFCDKLFPSKYNLHQHQRAIHENVNARVCHICAKVIRNKTLFDRHILKHDGIVEPKAQCTDCGIWLINRNGLRAHMRQHAERNKHVCNICNKVAPTKSSLRSHIEYNHTLKRSFKCSICSKAFKTSLTLKEHMTTHTGERLYTCSYCPKTFNSRANMYSHRKKVHRKEWEEGNRERFGNVSKTLQNEIEDTKISEQETELNLNLKEVNSISI